MIKCVVCVREMVYMGMRDVPIGDPPMDYSRTDSLEVERPVRPLVECEVYRCPRCRTVRLILPQEEQVEYSTEEGSKAGELQLV